MTYKYQADYSRGWWNNMKRLRISKLPKWIKPEPAPAKGLQISKVLLATTIMLPLMLVGSDMVSDGSVLGQMWPYTFFGKDLALAYSRNKTAEVNSTSATNSSSSSALLFGPRPLNPHQSSLSIRRRCTW